MIVEEHNAQAVADTLADFNTKLFNALAEVERLKNSVSGLTQLVNQMQTTINCMRAEIASRGSSVK